MSEFFLPHAEMEKNLEPPLVDRVVGSLSSTLKSIFLENINGHQLKKILAERLDLNALKKYVERADVESSVLRAETEQIRAEVLQHLQSFLEIEVEHAPNTAKRGYWLSRLNTVKNLL